MRECAFTVIDPSYGIFIDLLQGGVDALREYLSAHVLTCLIPAFFVAGAIAVFISQGAILRYFGPLAKKWLSYSVASVSGTILAVYSCTVLPLFGSIYKRGAGLGPAFTFLYSAPAINILAGPALSLPNMLVIRKIMGTQKTLVYVSLVVIMATSAGYIFGLATQ